MILRPGRFVRLSLVLAGAAVACLDQRGVASAEAAERCWTPDAMAARTDEKAITKGVRTFDTPSKARTLQPFDAVSPDLRGAIRRVKLADGKKWIALTFDLCETQGEIAGYDGAIFDYLRANGVKATLFAGGKWMRSHGERTQQIMADPLFEFGNHAEAHRNLRLLSGEALTNEIAGPQFAFEAARETLAGTQCLKDKPELAAHIPPRMSLFRFPFGACNAASLDAVNDAGLLAIQWDVSTGDPVPAQTAGAIAKSMIARAKPGSILIAHANGRGYHTAEAMPLAIPALRAKGFEFVTVSELLAAGTPEITATCYNTRPGDTDRYDTFFLPKKTSPKPAIETKPNERAPSAR